jgi:hypothetical protein
MCRKLTLSLLLVSILAMSAAAQEQVIVFSDDFETPHDYVADNVEGTGWDGYFGWLQGETVDSLNASVDREGQLYIASTGGYWHEPWNPLGPFLYKYVEGDFIASVKITDYAGTADTWVYHNDGGLMVRASKMDPDDEAGAGEDWISLDYFPIWSCGNFVWTADEDVRTEQCNNGKQFNSDPYLQIERKGNTFHFRTSVDGVTWEEMSCSPMTRDDFDGIPLQVGLRHATYSTSQGYVAFDDFIIEKTVYLKAYEPVPADGADDVTTAALQWQAGDTAAWHDIYFGTNPNSLELMVRNPAEQTSYNSGQSLIPGTTYYWRVDEVEADEITIHQGDVWSFQAVPLTAWNPNPKNNAVCILTDADLSWGAGSTASQHEVYFGTDETAVANATVGSPEFKGSQSEATFEPGELANDTTYYWRVDEVEADGTTRHQGRVWSFTTIAYIPVTDPALVGWWKFDNACDGTLVVDSSGYNNHGTLGGDPQWIVGNDVGALEFDGRDDYVDLPIGSVIGSLTSSTFALWVDFANAGGPWQHIFDFGNDTNVYMFLTPRTYFLGNLQFSITVNGSDAEFLVTDDETLSSGWHHVAVTMNDDTNIMVLYLDGEEVGRTSAVTITPSDLGNTTNNWLGRSQFTADAYYKGSLDDFRIYNYALSQAEIARAMRGDPLLAWNPIPVNGATFDILNTTPLSWSPGENAAEHDIYFGTDPNAVTDADTSTPDIYRGRQSTTSYTPPEGFEWGQTYYWRIDEYNNNGTISKGKLWVFTVADYLVVDDFEDYNDYEPDRIFDMWIDGYGSTTNGSTVGYAEPEFAAGEHFIETEIVHEGFQSLPYFYDNDMKYSEAVMTLESLRDWTIEYVRELSLWFRGYAAYSGSFVEDPAGTYTMTGSGVDIWGVTDEFHFAYKQLTGPGSITARVLSIDDTDVWAKAGVMIRNTLESDAKNTLTVITPSQGVSFQRRSEAGNESISVTEPGVTAPQWVKIERDISGNIISSYSSNGSNWTQLSTDVLNMNATVYIGLVVTSHNAAETCQAVFSNVTITGNVSQEPWMNQDIGILSNAAEQMYVVLNESAVVNNDNPNAAQLAEWTEWRIDLQDFADLGVDLTNVDSIGIGFGERNNPQAGGSGLVFFDDIRLYRTMEP